MAETHEARIAREEEEWTGPKLFGLMVVTLIVALSVIYVISSLKSGDYTWYPFGTTPKAADLQPSSVSGLTR